MSALILSEQIPTLPTHCECMKQNLHTNWRIAFSLVPHANFCILIRLGVNKFVIQLHSTPANLDWIITNVNRQVIIPISIKLQSFELYPFHSWLSSALPTLCKSNNNKPPPFHKYSLKYKLLSFSNFLPLPLSLYYLVVFFYARNVKTKVTIYILRFTFCNCIQNKGQILS